MEVEAAQTEIVKEGLSWFNGLGIPYSDSNWVKAGVVLLSAWLIAFVLSRAIGLLYKILGVKTKNRLDEKVFGILRRPVFWVVFIQGLQIALTIVFLSEKSGALISSIGKSVASIIIVVTAYRIAREVLQHTSKSRRKVKFVQRETLPLFQNLALILAFIFGTYLVFNAWNIDMTAWFASAGIAGVAIGFAAKDTLANLISGVFILADSPYNIGDTIVLDSGERGEVTHIGLRSTRLYTTDFAEVSVPNSIMGNSRVVNQSGGAQRKARIRAPIGVAYGSDIDQVRGELEKIASENKDVCIDPAPRVRFRQFGASSLDFELLFWIENAITRGRILDDINTTIYNTFNDKGIEIPFAKQDIYIKELPKNK